ncbi:MAG: sulfatase-like hydrolase/transferase [Bacteroidales bacterium]|nr:sulfatase-like hydrolase/transferase [Bacteroidales bacterium]
MNSTRDIARLVAIGGAALVGCGENGPANSGKKVEIPEKPNIVIVTLHDIGYYDFSYTGSDFYETPNIDYLASHGMQFDTHYGCGPNSSPSRAAMLTGRFSPYNNIYSTGFSGTESLMRLKQHEKNIVLSTESYTIAEALRDNGYATAFVGCWDPDDPTYQGFDYVKKSVFSATSGDPGANSNPKALNTDVKQACDYLDLMSAGSKPFFMLLNFNAIHTPLQSSQAYLDYFSAKAPGTKHNRVDYAACIKSADDAVAAIVEHLQLLNIEDNTIFIFTADHGPVFYSNQDPHSGFKGMCYEGAYRIPLIFYCPKYIPAGRVAMPTAGVDFFPTLMSLAGKKVAQKDTDGLSLVDYVFGKSVAPAQRPKPLYWHMPGYLSLGNYPASASRNANFRARPFSIVRDGDWKLILSYEEWLLDGGWDERETNKSIELYNLRTDVSEMHNLANEAPEIRDRLLRQLLDWVEESGAPIPEPKEAVSPIPTDDTPVTFPVSWPLGNGKCKDATMPYWVSQGYWPSSQPSAYCQFHWGPRPAGEAAGGYTPVLHFTNSGEISSPASQFYWTGDYFEFVLPVENFAAGTTVKMKLPFYGRQQPIFWDIYYLDGSEWKCNRTEQTSYDGSVKFNSTFALVRGGKVIEHDMTFTNAVPSGTLKFRMQCAEGKYQAATASAIAVREAPNCECGGTVVCYFYCAGSGVNDISFSIVE